MRLLLVFLDEPAEGRVLPRLAADVGEREATRRHRALVEVLLRQLQGLNDCRLRFCYAPDDAGDAIRFWLLPEMDATSSDQPDIYQSPNGNNSPPQQIDFRQQGSGDPGQRLRRAFDAGFADGFTEIAAIGSSCPACGARWINAAFARLADSRRDLVIGPGNDGGYYLLAMKSPAPQLFHGIPWGTDRVFQHTLTTATTSGLQADPLPTLASIRCPQSWQELMETPLAAAIRKAMGEPPGFTSPSDY